MSDVPDDLTDAVRELAALGTELHRAPVRQNFALYGRWRIYFNRHGAEPLMWCISMDDGSFELAVTHVTIRGHAKTVYRKKETPDDEDGKPSAWIEAEGMLTVILPDRISIEEP